MQITDSRQLRIEHSLAGQQPKLARLYEADKGLRTALIFVHGFISDSQGTWGLADDGYFWPIQLGIETQCDVFCLEYLNHGNKHRKEGSLGIEDLADFLAEQCQQLTRSSYDRLIFVTHSFGGLLAKQLFTQLATHADPGFRSVASAVAGLFLISCPNRGHSFAYLLRTCLRDVVSRNLRFMGARDADRLGDAFLREHDRHLSTLRCETVGEEGYLFRIFRVHPLDAQLRDDIKHHVDPRNHSAVCKTLSAADPLFQILKRFIGQITAGKFPGANVLGAPYSRGQYQG